MAAGWSQFPHDLPEIADKPIEINRSPLHWDVIEARDALLPGSFLPDIAGGHSYMRLGPGEMVSLIGDGLIARPQVPPEIAGPSLGIDRLAPGALIADQDGLPPLCH